MPYEIVVNHGLSCTLQGAVDSTSHLPSNAPSFLFGVICSRGRVKSHARSSVAHYEIKLFPIDSTHYVHDGVATCAQTIKLRSNLDELLVKIGILGCAVEA